MDLTRLFETQKVLDERIVQEKGLEGQDLLPEKILALQVELGELANEWRGFKFWSKDQKPRTFKSVYSYLCKECGPQGSVDCKKCGSENRLNEYNGNPLLEEYVDCLHFILSIGNEIIAESLEYMVPDVREPDATHQILSLMREINSLHHLITYGMKQPFDAYRIIILRFINLGRMLGFTWEQIEQAYYAKNEINHQRQATGY